MFWVMTTTCRLIRSAAVRSERGFFVASMEYLRGEGASTARLVSWGSHCRGGKQSPRRRPAGIEERGRTPRFPGGSGKNRTHGGGAPAGRESGRSAGVCRERTPGGRFCPVGGPGEREILVTSSPPSSP